MLERGLNYVGRVESEASGSSDANVESSASLYKHLDECDRFTLCFWNGLTSASKHYVLWQVHVLLALATCYALGTIQMGLLLRSGKTEEPNGDFVHLFRANALYL